MNYVDQKGLSIKWASEQLISHSTDYISDLITRIHAACDSL